MASDTDIAGDLLDRVIELRGTEAMRFIARDAPTFACPRRSLDEPLDSLG